MQWRTCLQCSGCSKCELTTHAGVRLRADPAPTESAAVTGHAAGMPVGRFRTDTRADPIPQHRHDYDSRFIVTVSDSTDSDSE